MNKLYVGIGVVVVLLLGLSYYAGTYHSFGYDSTVYNCSNPAPSELCASDQFYNDFQRWKLMNKDISKKAQSSAVMEFQNEIDLSKGLQDRLGAEIPSGYDWNEQKARFVKKPIVAEAPAQTTPATATPAPVTPAKPAPPPPKK